MKDLLLVCIGSFWGGGARYLVGRVVLPLMPVSIPWGTMIVNVIGCFLIGLLSGLSLGGQISSSAQDIKRQKEAVDTFLAGFSDLCDCNSPCEF